MAPRYGATISYPTKQDGGINQSMAQPRRVKRAAALIDPRPDPAADADAERERHRQHPEAVREVDTQDHNMMQREPEARDQDRRHHGQVALERAEDEPAPVVFLEERMDHADEEAHLQVASGGRHIEFPDLAIDALRRVAQKRTVLEPEKVEAQDRPGHEQAEAGASARP